MSAFWNPTGSRNSAVPAGPGAACSWQFRGGVGGPFLDAGGVAAQGRRTSTDGGRDAEVVGAGAGPSPPEMRVSVAAAVLNSGCLETGSQAVIVASFAARGGPSGRSHDP